MNAPRTLPATKADVAALKTFIAGAAIAVVAAVLATMFLLLRVQVPAQTQPIVIHIPSPTSGDRPQ